MIDVSKLDNDGKVIFGSTIMLQNLDTEESLKYKIVGKDEADLKEKLILIIIIPKFVMIFFSQL